MWEGWDKISKWWWRRWLEERSGTANLEAIDYLQFNVTNISDMPTICSALLGRGEVINKS